MAQTEASQRLADAILDFSVDGRFPQNIDTLPPVSHLQLSPAIEALEEKRLGLEVLRPTHRSEYAQS